MRPEEAGDYINVKPSTLRWWRCMGYGPVFHKYGNAVRYLKSDLDKFIANTVSVKHNGRAANEAPVKVEPTVAVKRGRGRPRKWVKVAV
ncbi:MAG: helix-turn-helix domain-containing protein [Bryobacterales bacterium]|nr:helix-turn-helix domain-containing protein [Bryobacterales bacterium]